MLLEWLLAAEAFAAISSFWIEFEKKWQAEVTVTKEPTRCRSQTTRLSAQMSAF
jgi:hypothetical protein